MKEILLIGNGPSAAKHTMGKAIDSFPCVARFNTFRIHGYKEYVGSKCDIWFACDNFPQWQRLYDYKEVYFVNPVRNEPNPKFARFKADMPNAQLLPAWVWDDVCAEMKTHPSSGALAAYYFSKSYDRVYLYGFDCFGADKHHYGDSNNACHHKADKERAFINKLISEGVVRQFNNYTILHDNPPSYGSGGCYFSRKIMSYNPASVLDYGCGKGMLVKHLREQGMHTEGYDPYVLEWQARPAKQYLLVSTDFLEHIPEEDLVDVFDDMRSYEPRMMYHVISNRKATQILPDGTNAHKTVKDADWWLSRLHNEFANYNVEQLEHNENNNFTTYYLELKGDK